MARSFKLAQVESLRIVLDRSDVLSASVHFELADRRYHVWFNADGGISLGNTLHSNPRDLDADHDHRGLDLTAKVWARLAADLKEWVTVEKVEAIRAQLRAAEQKAEEERLDNTAERARNALLSVAEDVKNPEAFKAEVRDLSRDSLIILWQAFAARR